MDSKVCYGKTFLESKDLRDSNIKNRIELEYYRIKNKKNLFIKENSKCYGIEIVKKEYQGRKVNIEKEKIERVSNTKAKIDNILYKLQKFKVTPICLKDVLDDITHN